MHERTVDARPFFSMKKASESSGEGRSGGRDGGYIVLTPVDIGASGGSAHFSIAAKW